MADSNQQLLSWIEDYDQNTEYFSLDAETEEPVPEGSAAVSVAGLFTFFLQTRSPFSAALPSSLSGSEALAKFVGLIAKAKPATLPAALAAATKAYAKIADERDAEVAAGGGAEAATYDDDDMYGGYANTNDGAEMYGTSCVAAAADEQVVIDPKAAERRAADKLLRELRERYAASTVMVNPADGSEKPLPTGTIERLLRDLAVVQKGPHHGWSARPMPTTDGSSSSSGGGSGGNLALWEVSLYDFDKGTPLANDMAKLATMSHHSSSAAAASSSPSSASSSAGVVTLYMRFPPEYPNRPPFVRVVRPRFAFRTGRVTVGGSICTELLVQEGWQPTYDIESIIESLRQQITDPEAGARVDFHNMTEYTEAEAVAAFNRVASDHGWSVMK